MSTPILSLQLYSARNFPPADSQLATVREAGFTAVETFGPFHDDVAATRRLLDKHGLEARSGHFGIEMAEQQTGRTIAVARDLGLAYVVIPYLPPQDRPGDADGWAALGRRLQAVGDRFAAEGLPIAWHNHDFEFAPLPDGSLPLTHILGDTLLWEADLAWIVKGGADPVRWLERYRGRVPLVHVKDIAAPGEKTDEDGWADVGAGILPWTGYWPRCLAAGAQVMIAEHDNPSDFARFARTSAVAMRRLAEEGER